MSALAAPSRSHLSRVACFASLLSASVPSAAEGLRDVESNDEQLQEIVVTATRLPVPGSEAWDSPRGKSGDEPIEEIVVTGTRLPMPAIAPVTVLTSRDINRSGADSIAKVLETLPMVTSSPLHGNPNTGVGYEPTAGGSISDGAARVDLRGLGPERTVVLLNGNRWPNGGMGADSSVNLNTIPISWIERIDVLPSGASTIYGSGAVGGVINIITRRGFKGMEVSGSRSMAHGDGEIVTGKAAASLGAWDIGLDYATEDSVTLSERAYSAVPLMFYDGPGTIAYAGVNATAQGFFRVPEGNTLELAPGDYTRVDGATGQTAADYRPYRREVDGFNPASFNYLQHPDERRELWLNGSHQLGERVHFTMEGLVAHNESSVELAPEVYYAGRRSPAPTLADGWPGIPANNYYNPFGLDLAWITNGKPVPVARRFVEAGNRSAHHDDDLWRVLIGFDGNFGRWTWTATASDAQSKATTVEANFFIQERFSLALGPSGVDDGGHVVCGKPNPATGRVPAARIIPGCVPLNLFGGVGSITQEQLDYMAPRSLVSTGTNAQQTAQLLFRGPLGRVFGRDVEWAAGLDYRREAGRFTPDPLTLTNSGAVKKNPTINGVVSKDLVPSEHSEARESFVEVNVPLARERRWARELTLSFSTRWQSDLDPLALVATTVSSFGQTAPPWEAGLSWQPAEQLALRANYAQTFRAPSLAELHTAQKEIDSWEDDPCAHPTGDQQANCAASGAPQGGYVQSFEPFVRILGGNPEIGPETGHSVGTGLTYTPEWGQGLSVSVNFFQTEFAGFIAPPEVANVLSECADKGTPEACHMITRFADGNIEQVVTLNANLTAVETGGADVSIEWHGTTRFGELTPRLFVTYLARSNEQPFLILEHHAGTFDNGVALPHWRASGSLDWGRGPWTASYAAEYIGDYVEEVYAFAPYGFDFDTFTRRVDSVLYHDLSGGFRFDAGVTVRGAINNVLDTDPPYVDNGSLSNTDDGSYRLLGRTFFLEVGYAFK